MRRVDVHARAADARTFDVLSLRVHFVLSRLPDSVVIDARTAPTLGSLARALSRQRGIAAALRDLRGPRARTHAALRPAFGLIPRRSACSIWASVDDFGSRPRASPADRAARARLQFEGREGALRRALASGDSERIRHEAVLLWITAGRAQAVGFDARSCLGDEPPPPPVHRLLAHARR